VLPEDVRSLVHDVLRHRLVLTYEALAESIDADAVLARVLEAVEAPAVTLSRTEAA
jgi:MoxR-like ATPase